MFVTLKVTLFFKNLELLSLKLYYSFFHIELLTQEIQKNKILELAIWFVTS